MAKEANLLVTFDPTHQESVLKGIEDVLKGIKEKCDVVNANEGVAELIVSDAKKAVKQLSSIFDKEAEKFTHTFHWIPIEKWCDSTIDEMQKQIKELANDIKQDDKWKMDLKVRKVKEKPDEIKLILKLTEVIDKPKVDLQNPDKIIKVEIIGNRAGLALLGKDELLNTAKK